MNLKEKLIILSDSAKYDASCSSSGSNRTKENGLGNTAISGICHSFSSDGRCISLLKILMTNACIYDCKYCINRRSNNIKRATFTPEEICNITINFYIKLLVIPCISIIFSFMHFFSFLYPLRYPLGHLIINTIFRLATRTGESKVLQRVAQLVGIYQHQAII